MFTLDPSFSAKPIRSNASRLFFKIQANIVSKSKIKPLSLSKRWNGGRNGSIIFRNRGRRLLFNKLFFHNFSGRLNVFSLIINFHVSYLSRRVFVIVVLSHGAAMLIPANESSVLFKLNGMPRMQCNSNEFTINRFDSIFQFLMYIAKRSFVSFLTRKPILENTWIRSSGSKGLLFSKDRKTKLILVRMPSKQFKFFPPLGLGLDFPVWGLPRRFQSITKCGFHIATGRKPVSRGVARNPVDHPHGGRTKTILAPVSPWGWITKRK